VVGRIYYLAGRIVLVIGRFILVAGRAVPVAAELFLKLAKLSTTTVLLTVIFKASIIL
jgi:hypothetical protein